MPAESARLLTRPDLGLSKRRGAFCLVPRILPIMNQKASLQVQHDGVAIVTLQNPPVNALHPAGVLHFSACSAAVHLPAVTGRNFQFSEASHQDTASEEL